MTTDLTLTENTLPFAQAMESLGIVDESGSSNAPIIPRISINNKTRSASGAKIPDGTIRIDHPQYGVVYAEKAWIRVFQQRFFYQRYDENAIFQTKEGKDVRGRYVNRSVFVRNPYDEALDELGTINCGKKKIEDWDKASEADKEWWRGSKRYRVLFGLLRVENAVKEGNGETVSFDNFPVIYQIASKDTFKNFGNVLSELHKTKKLPYSHELKFNMEYKQTPAVSWYIVNPTIEPESLELTEDDINTNKVFNEFILTHNETVRQKASEASKRLDEAEGILDSEDFIEVEATAS